jgi:curli biogenesis system outer membrane secretion channel CsgG
MNMRLVAAIVLAVFVAGCGSSRKAVKGPKIAITFTDFEARSGVTPDEALTIRDAFSAALQQTGRFTIVDRKATAAILAEQEFQAEQQTAGAQVQKGKIQSLRKMIGGSVSRLGGDFVFNIKMTDIETAAVDFAVSKMFNGDMEDVIDDFLPELAQEVLKSVQSQ